MGGGRKLVATYNHGVADCGGIHGTNYTYGCRCDACKEWSYMKSKRYSLRKIRGEVDHLVDAGPTRAMILRLREMGYTNKELNRFGVYGVHDILYGGRRVKASTERKVAAITGRKLVDTQRVDNQAAIMLVRGWKESGLTDAEIGNACCLGRQTVADLKKGSRPLMQAKTLGKILRAKPKLDDLAMSRREGL